MNKIIDPTIFINTVSSINLNKTYNFAIDLYLDRNCSDNSRKIDGFGIFNLLDYKDKLKDKFLELINEVEKYSKDSEIKRFNFLIPIYYSEIKEYYKEIDEKLQRLFSSINERSIAFNIKCINFYVFFYSPEEFFSESSKLLKETFGYFNKQDINKNIFVDIFLFSNRNGYTEEDIQIQIYNLINLITFGDLKLNLEEDDLTFLKINREHDSKNRVYYYCLNLSVVEYPKSLLMKLIKNYNIIENFKKVSLNTDVRIREDIKNDIEYFFFKDKINFIDNKNSILSNLEKNYEQEFSSYFDYFSKEVEGFTLPFNKSKKVLIYEINKRFDKENVKKLIEKYKEIFKKSNVKNLYNSIASIYEENLQNVKEDFFHLYKDKIESYFTEHEDKYIRLKWGNLSNYFEEIYLKLEKNSKEIEQHYFNKGEIFLKIDESIKNFNDKLLDSIEQLKINIKNLKNYYPLLTVLFIIIIIIIMFLNILIINNKIFSSLIIIAIFVIIIILFFIRRRSNIKKYLNDFKSEINTIKDQMEKFKTKYYELLKQFWIMRAINKLKDLTYDYYRFYNKLLQISDNAIKKSSEEKNKIQLKLPDNYHNINMVFNEEDIFVSNDKISEKYCNYSLIKRFNNWVHNNRVNSILLNDFSFFEEKFNEIYLDINKSIETVLEDCNEKFLKEKIFNNIQKVYNKYVTIIDQYKFSYISDKHPARYRLKNYILFDSSNMPGNAFNIDDARNLNDDISARSIRLINRLYNNNRAYFLTFYDINNEDI